MKAHTGKILSRILLVLGMTMALLEISRELNYLKFDRPDDLLIPIIVAGFLGFALDHKANQLKRSEPGD